jgi:phosphopantothenoylcysteine decarboxylase/phosphopantothenate--cysteine ligase
MSVAAPPAVAVTTVESTDEMKGAIDSALPSTDVLIMAAAPADFRPSDPAGAKIKKSDSPAPIALAATPDILQSTRGKRRRDSVVVGFALETNDVLANGRRKLASKDLDLIVVNDATEAGAGFGTDTNRVTLISRDGAEARLPLMSKVEVADAILDRVEALLDGR